MLDSSAARQWGVPATATRSRGSVAVFLVGFAIAISGLFGAARGITVSDVSALGILSLLVTAAALILLLADPVIPRRCLGAMTPLWLFLGYASLSLMWSTYRTAGIQNITVIAAFATIAMLTARESHYRNVSRTIRRALVVSGAFGSLLYLYSLVSGGIGSKLFARAFALFALPILAWFLAEWRYGRRRSLVLALALTLLVGLSLSRLGLFICIVLFVMAQVRLRRPSDAVRSALVIGAVGFLAWYALFNFAPLRDRFFEGDLSLQIGSIPINASGRAEMWEVVIDSMRESPFIGKGAGTAGLVVEAVYPGLEHPHSDYLRIAHDYGLIGMGLWILAYTRLMLNVFRRWRRRVHDGDDSSSKVIDFAALLSLVALGLAMTTDNALAYFFVMVPTAAMVGLSMGKREEPRPQPAAGSAARLVA